MSRAEYIKFIVIHCTAGYGSIDSIIKYWRESLGWNGNGYAIIIDLDGIPWYITKNRTYTKDIDKADIGQVTNGVRGWNDISIHISYIGGVQKNNYKIAKDTRTDAQKIGLIKAIDTVVYWLYENGKDISKSLGIVGHRDFSNDKNGNGLIESWERIKECPSFDAIPEYKHMLMNSENDVIGMLPSK